MHMYKYNSEFYIEFRILKYLRNRFVSVVCKLVSWNSNRILRRLQNSETSRKRVRLYRIPSQNSIRILLIYLAFRIGTSWKQADFCLDRILQNSITEFGSSFRILKLLRTEPLSAELIRILFSFLNSEILCKNVGCFRIISQN